MFDEMYISFHSKCERIRLNHLMFADDLLIFAKANEKSAYGIGVALRWSFYATMLFINDSKSNIFHVGISDVIKDSVASALNMEPGLLPIKYLDVPIYRPELLLHYVLLWWTNSLFCCSLGQTSYWLMQVGCD